MFKLLSGQFPFYGDTYEEIFESIQYGKYSLDGPCWTGVSP